MHLISAAFARRSSCALVLVGLACHVAAADNPASKSDPKVEYRNNTVSVDASTGVRTYRGEMSETRNCGNAAVFQSDCFANFKPYVGTYDPKTRRATEDIGYGKNRGTCSDDPWILPDPVFAPYACGNVILETVDAARGITPSRWPFSAKWGGFPYGERKIKLDEALAALETKKRTPDGAPIDGPQAVRAFVYASSVGKQGSVLFLLPKIGERHWIDRFDVELAFVPHATDTSPANANWLPDGSLAGPALPVTSTTDPNQYYTTKKKDYYEDTRYWLRVCAVNLAGRTCSPAVVAQWEKPTNESVAVKGGAGSTPPEVKSRRSLSSGTSSAMQPVPNWGDRGAAPAAGTALKSSTPQWGGLPPAPATIQSGPTPGAAIPPVRSAVAAQATSGQVAPVHRATPDNAVAVPKAEPAVTPAQAMNAPPTAPATVSAAAKATAMQPTALPAKPNKPVDVIARMIDRDVKHASVQWRVPSTDGARRIEAFRVLPCPVFGQSYLCGGGSTLVADAGGNFNAGSTVGTTVPATAPVNNQDTPVVKVQVCAENAAGISCADPVDVAFWRAPKPGGAMQVKR